MKVKNFNKSHCYRLVVAGNLVQGLQLAHRTFCELNLIGCHVFRAGVHFCPTPYTSRCYCPPPLSDAVQNPLPPSLRYELCMRHVEVKYERISNLPHSGYMRYQYVASTFLHLVGSSYIRLGVHETYMWSERSD